MSTRNMAGSRIEHWRARAEEYRTTSESIVSHSVRDTYLTLARHCDQIADNLGRRSQIGSLRLG